MKQLFYALRKFVIGEQKKVLGRWNIDYCNKKINNKIDLSNEDHCGPCGQYILNTREKMTLKEKEIRVKEHL